MNGCGRLLWSTQMWAGGGVDCNGGVTERFLLVGVEVSIAEKDGCWDSAVATVIEFRLRGMKDTFEYEDDVDN
jgi:hypothetical protein